MQKLAGLLMLLATGAACADPGASAVRRDAGQAAAVAFWTSGYSGAELASGNFGCAAPEVPALSHVEPQTTDVWKAITGWEACHAGVMAKLASTPAEARIPADVLASMSPAERAQARAHVQAVQARIAQAAQANGAATMARHETWLRATVGYVAEQKRSKGKDVVDRARTDAYAARLEADRRRSVDLAPPRTR